MNLYLAEFIGNAGPICTRLYHDREEFLLDTSPYRDPAVPGCTEIYTMTFSAHGHTWSERQNHIRSLAIDWSHVNTEGMDLYDICEIESFFRKMGKRYGLLREFKENAIC